MRGLGSAACLSILVTTIRHVFHTNCTDLPPKTRPMGFFRATENLSTGRSRDAAAICFCLARCSRIRSSRIGFVAWTMMSCPSFAKRRGTEQTWPMLTTSQRLTMSHHYPWTHSERWAKAMQLVDDDIISTAGSRDAGVIAEEQCQ